jgi:hypothetical protein
MQLKANGHEVYGFGERKTPAPFVNACTAFLYLDTLDEALPVAASRKPAAKPKSKAKAKAADKAEPAAKPADKEVGKQLSEDTQLITILRGAVAATVREDGWAPMSAVGSAARRQAPIDPRNYGVKNFAALFAATGLFDIVKLDGGHSYVADKHNKDRAAEPNR